MAMKVRLSKKKCCYAKYKTIILFSAIFLVIGGLITVLSKTVGTTGHAVYEIGQEVIQEEAINDASIQAEIYAREETTKDGLIVKYDILEQGLARLNRPVRWQQKITVTNPKSKTVEGAVVKIEGPLDAENMGLFMYDEMISGSPLVHLPKIKPKKSIDFLLTFETDSVKMEIIEEEPDYGKLLTREIFSMDTIKEILNGPIRKVRIWHDSSLHYHDIVIEMDVSLGERIVKISEDAEKSIEFNYDEGKAIWIIEKL